MSALLAGGLLLGGALTPVHSAAASPTRVTAAQAGPAKAQEKEHRVTVALSGMSPAVPREGGTVTLTGTVTNNGRAAVTDPHVAVRVGLNGEPLSSRSNLAEVADRHVFTYLDGDEIPERSVDLPTLTSGVSRPFTLKVPVDELGLRGNGVYQLSVSVSGESKDVDGEPVLGIERTFLPWYPAPEQTEHTRVSVLWPLVDRPHMDARTDTDSQQTPIFRDDRLATELAPGGRLGQLLEVGKQLPVTWVIDPDLLAAAAAMAEGYKVAASDDSTEDAKEGTGSAVAARWLRDLRAAVRDQQVVALPFGDPDLASIAHRADTVPGTLKHLRPAAQLARATTRTILGVDPRTDLAWPVAGAADRSVIDVARAAGASRVVVSSSALNSGRLNRTPNSPRPLGGGTTALVADAPLSTAFDGGTADAEESVLAVQTFLAQSLMITMESPSSRRSLLVAPERWLTASSAHTLADALEEGTDGGWLTPIDLETLEKTSPDERADRTLPPAADYPKRLRRQELSVNAFRRIEFTRSSLQRFLQILSQRDRADPPFSNAVLRAMSTSWRLDHDAATAYRVSLDRHLAGLKGAVRIRDKSDVTLSGSSGTLQITVENNLNQQVENLVLELRSAETQRFTVAEAQDVTIGGRHRKTFEFSTSAHANGRATVVAQLLTEDGVPYGEPVTFQVRVTSVTGTVLIVIACGVLLLLLAGARMYRQRKRAALQVGDDGDDDGEDGDRGSGSEGGDARRDGGSGGHGDDRDGWGDGGGGSGWGTGPGNPGPGWDHGDGDGRRAPDHQEGEQTVPAAGRPASTPGDRAPWETGDSGPDTAGGNPVAEATDEKVER